MSGMPHDTIKAQRTVQQLCADVVEQLAAAAALLNPETSREVFLDQVYHTLRAEDADGDDLLFDYRSENGGKLGVGHLMVVCCAYCVQAIKSSAEIALARTYLMDAIFYLGMVRAGLLTEPQMAHKRDAILKEVGSTHARNSSRVNTKPWRDAKEETWNLLRSRHHQGERFDTPLSAAVALGAHLEAFLKAARPPKRFATAQARNDTIEGWIKEMSDVAQLFGPR